MPVPCPCCKAANDTGPACRRCKADLSLLFAAAARRDWCTAAAAESLAGGDVSTALQLANEAEFLGADCSAIRTVCHPEPS